MAWVTPPTFSATTSSADDMNDISGDLQWLKDALVTLGITSDTGTQTISSAVAGAHAYRSSDQNIADATDVEVSFTSERWDLFDNAASTYHSTASNQSRVTIPSGKGGYYLIGANIAFESNATGRRIVRFLVNGTSIIHQEVRNAVTGSATIISLECVRKLNATDYVEVQVRQNSTTTLAVQALADYSPEFWCVLLGV